ncbi:ABC transporter substrate-binding protein [Granulosicoccus sp. 3-233]|uniref:ABC transporter substrate-binding protein n=1 Tax=Granulosicoccus sp. 3-233 TaxID=3417969 RepID=UPI003D34F50C
MKHLLKSTAAASLLLGTMSLASAQADCGIDKGRVSILSDDFEAMHVVADRAVACASDTVQITTNQTAEHKNIQVPALSAEPATYTVAIVPNNSLPPLLNEDLVRPLDALIDKFRPALQDHQLIRIDGKVMAIAFMVNTQHLWYRKDLLEAAGVEPPESYEEVLTVAAALREQGIKEYPLALNLKPGWDLGTEFLNMYQGFGGELFKDNSAEPRIDSEEGVRTLNMLKELSEYMSPEFATFDTNEVSRRWAAGELAIYNGWSSRPGGIIDPEGSSAPEVIANSAFGAAPTVAGGTTPASYLWWVGFTIARNISDEDAEASFQAMMHAISPELLETSAEQAVWLIAGYQPTAASTGAFLTVEAGAEPFPMLPYMGLLHTALSENLIEFLQGKESAEQALADATQAYRAAATEAGYLK